MQHILSYLNGIPQPTSKASSMRKIGHIDMRSAIDHGYLILNTLPESLQGCLIRGSIVAAEEEEMMNEILMHDELDKIIVLYGSNAADESVDTKYRELVEVGFRRVYVYAGGLFEWLLLQDIYNETEFPTTSKQTDILRFQPSRRKF